MRYLGIDLGEIKVGLAHADSSIMLALPIGTLVPSKNVDDIRWIMPIIEEYSIEEIVIGLPFLMDGSVGHQALRVKEFIRIFTEQVGLPVHEWDERLTTYQAQKLLKESGLSPSKRKDKEDSLVASLLLQSFLDSKTMIRAS